MGLTSHYRLNGDLTDRLGGESGVFIGNPYWVTGQLRMAAKFDGLSYIKLPIDVESDPKEFSITFRAKTDSLGNYKGLIQLQGVDTYENGLVLTIQNTDQLRIRYWTDSVNGTSIPWSAGEFANGEPAHFCLTIKHRRICVYQNGQLVVDHVYMNPLKLNGECNVGLYSWDGNYFEGWIEDVRVYNHALSQSDAYELSLGLFGRYPLLSNLGNIEGGGDLTSIGAFVDTDRGRTLNVRNTMASISNETASLRLKDETIVFWQKSEFNRLAAGGGSFTNRIIHWGDYYGNNSGGLGLQTGDVRVYLRGPGATGWTDHLTISTLNDLYDTHEWIQYAIVFGKDNRFKIYANATLHLDIALSVPYTGLTSDTITFGLNMLAHLSDVRIYKTELNENDIVRLYRSKCCIGDDGSFRTERLIESGVSSSISPLGHRVSELSEAGLADGLSYWLPMRRDLRNMTSPNDPEVHNVASGLIGYRFDSTLPSHLELGPLGLFDGSREFSVFVWANATGVSGIKPRDVIFNPLSEGYFALFVTENGYSVGYYSKDPIDRFYTIDVISPHSKWVHVGMTYDPLTKLLKMYFNGNYIDSLTVVGVIYRSSNVNYLGSDRWPGQREYDGELADFRVYDKAVSEKDVAQLHQLTNWRESTTTISSPTMYVKNSVKECVI